jgi:hypothetical protein
MLTLDADTHARVADLFVCKVSSKSKYFALKHKYKETLL